MSEEIATIEDAELAETQASLNLFGARDPVAVIEQAEKVATALKDVIEKKKLYRKIGEKDHVYVEGWTLLGSMLGVFPVPVWTRKLEDGWEARVEARTRSGDVVGAADAMCTRSEARWKTADEYAIRSMAQTRATSKALRLPLGFVVTLAGYEATPADEIPDSGASPRGANGKGEAPGTITDAQQRKMGVLIKKLEEAAPQHEGQLSWVGMLRERYGVASRKQMTRKQASDAIDWLEGCLSDAGIPF